MNKNNTEIKKNPSNSNDNSYKADDAVTLADEHLNGSPLSIKETLIWLEESKIFFYRIKQSMESKEKPL
ncbi:MAG: hypothetical protein M1276_01605 [Deltaproteobacteria bacterium]|jgi:hypothetical protein|nr:hypothetical protein [Deltaproteobacteria bacterium]